MKVSDIYEKLPSLDQGAQRQLHIPADTVTGYFQAVEAAYDSSTPALVPLNDLPLRQWNCPVYTDEREDRFEVSLIKRDGIRFARFLAKASVGKLAVVEGVMIESGHGLDYASGRVKTAEGRKRSLAFSSESLGLLTGFIMEKTAGKAFKTQRAAPLDRRYRRDFREALIAV